MNNSETYYTEPNCPILNVQEDLSLVPFIKVQEERNMLKIELTETIHLKNGYIEDIAVLEQKVKDLKEVDELNTELENEKSECIDKIDNLEYEKEELEGQVEDLEEKVSRKKDKINTLKEEIVHLGFTLKGENENLKEEMKYHKCSIFSVLGDNKTLKEENEELKLISEWGKSATLKWNDELALNKKLKEENEKLKTELEKLKVDFNEIEELHKQYENSSSEEEDEDNLYECLYCGASGNPYNEGWVSERCRKNDENKVYLDHPDCDYKGFICSSCQWYGEQMCYKCRPLNGEKFEEELKEKFEEELKEAKEKCEADIKEAICGGTVELKSKEDINMDATKKKLASALSRLNSVKKICESEDGNLQEVQFIMDGHSGKGDLISQKHSENEIRLAKIDKEYQEYQLFLETNIIWTENDFNNASAIYVSKINKILEE